MKTSICGTLLLVPLALVSCGDAGTESVIVHGTAIEHGRALFDDASIAKTEFNTYSCATCHDGEGSGGDTIKMGGSLRGAIKRTSFWGGQEVDLLRSVNQCLYWFMLKDDPWTPEDTEARAVYAYLESISKGDVGTEPLPFTAVVNIGDVPQGEKTKGAIVFQHACQECHGEIHTGEGRLVDRAPILPEQTLSDHPLGNYTKDEQRLVFVEKVRHGAFISYTGQMPPFSLEALPNSDLGALLEYLELY